MTNEAEARVRINAQLELAGYLLDGSDPKLGSVGFERDIRNREMKKRIVGPKKKIPDYHLYPPQSNNPVAFIEAKRIGKSLDDALNQALKTAKIATGSKVPNLILFASDGIQVKSMHGNREKCYINNSVVDYFPSIEIIQALLKTPSLEIGEKITAVKQVISLFEEAANIMRSDGIDPGIDQLREFSRFLFIKIMAERNHRASRKRWKQLTEATGKTLSRVYRSVLNKYAEEYGDIFSRQDINRAETIETLVSKLEAVNLTNSGMDIKGEAFEFFLSSYSAGNKSHLGQFFTPRHITNMMAQLLNPQPGDLLLDPFCGTGGMLISSYHHIRNQYDKSDKNFKKKEKHLKQHALSGKDISAAASSLAKMNMILLGDGHTNIIQTDSLRETEMKKFDKLITNIPFNIKNKIDKEIYTKYYKLSQINKLDWNKICTIHCVESVNNGGSIAMVVPLTLCHANKYQDVRNYLANKGQIRCVLRLPEKTFIRYTAAQAAVLIIDNLHKQTTHKFPLIHIKSDGMSQNTLREPISDNDIPDIVEYLTNSLNDPQKYKNAICIRYHMECDFLGFANPTTQEKYWELGELLDVKVEPYLLSNDKLYAEPSLSSNDNTIKPKGVLRLGRNIKGKKKKLAKKGDLIIATLHTNRDNGLFAVADQDYICTSQIVARVKTRKVPLDYLLLCLRSALPNQLLPTDLVGREPFTVEQILSTIIPKPSKKKLKEIRKISKDLSVLKQRILKKREKLRFKVANATD